MTDIVEEMAREIERTFAADPICGGRFCGGTAEAAAKSAYTIVERRIGELTEALFNTRNALAIVGRSCAARASALEAADGVLADYPPFVAMKAQTEAMTASLEQRSDQ